MLRFEDFELCEETRELRRGGAPLALQPKVLDLLLFLIHHRHRVVADAELLAVLWRDAVVTSASLSRALKELRRALGDDGRRQRLVRTHRGRGYRFVAAVQEQAPTDDDVYVGRPALLAALDRALADTRGGTGSLHLFVGPAGIGKTRTAIELARRAWARGLRVAWAHCDAGAGAPPLAPWWRLLYALGGAPFVPMDAESAADGSRFGLFTRYVEPLEQMGTRGRTLLVVDDLHASDFASVALLAFLASEIPRLPLVLCATLRSEEVERNPDLGRQISTLARRERVTLHELAGLDAAEVARFVALRAGSEPPADAVAALRAVTQGNPFFLDELMRGGLREGDRERSWSAIVPRGLEHVLHARLARLAATTRSVLHAAAVLGEGFESELLGRVARRDVDDALAEGRAEQLVEDWPRGSGRHRFSHALFREALLAELSESERSHLHARAARALEQRAEQGFVGAEEVAAHWLAAGAHGEPARAVAWAHRAGRRALAAQGWEQAEQLLRRATDLCAAGARVPAEVECDLWIRLADARNRRGDRTGAEQAGARAAALARRHGWAARYAEAVLAQVGPPLQFEHPDPALSQLLAEAGHGLGPEQSPLAARLAARRAAAHVLDDDVALAGALRRDALHAALSCGDAQVLAEVLSTPYAGIWAHVEPDRRLALADTCIERGRAQDNPVAEGRGAIMRLAELIGLGALDRFDREVDAVEARMLAIHEPAGRYQVLLHRATRALVAGAFADAEQAANRALALGRRLELPTVFELFAIQLTLIRREQGRIGELAGNEALFFRHPNASVRAFFAWSFAENGDEPKARPLLAEAIERDLPALGVQPSRVANAAVLTRACALLGVRECASALAAVLAPYRERVVERGTVGAHGPGAWFLATAARLAGREREVRPSYEAALALCRRAGAPAWRAEIEYDLAEWLAETGDATAARPLAARAARSAAALGQHGLRPRAEALVARLGARSTRRASRAGRSRAQTHPGDGEAPGMRVAQRPDPKPASA